MTMNDTNRGAMPMRSTWPTLIGRVAIIGGLTAAALLSGLWLYERMVLPVDDGASHSRRLAVSVFVAGIVLLGVAAVTRWIDRQPLTVIGLLPLRQGWRSFAIGALCWFVPALVTVSIATVLGIAQLTTNPPLGSIAILIAGHLLIVFLIEAFPEELAFRGYLGSAFGERLSAWPAIVAQAACFTLFGYLVRVQTSMVDLSLFAAMGLVFGYFRLLTGSIWTSIGFHMAFQTGTQLLIGGYSGPMRLETSQGMGMILLGVVPFMAGVMAVEWLSRTRPSLFHGRPRQA